MEDTNLVIIYGTLAFLIFWNIANTLMGVMSIVMHKIAKECLELLEKNKLDK